VNFPENAQQADVVLSAEQGADIYERTIADLAERRRNFLFLRGREEPVTLDQFAAFDRGQKMAVNRLGTKPRARAISSTVSPR